VIPDEQAFPTVFDHEFARTIVCARHRLISIAELCGGTIEIENVSARMDVGTEICTLQNFDFAKSSQRNALRSGCLLPQHASPVHEGSSANFRKARTTILTSILFPQAGARRMWLSLDARRSRNRPRLCPLFLLVPEEGAPRALVHGGSSESPNFRNRAEKTSGRSFQ